jgi:hypothetical protein
MVRAALLPLLSPYRFRTRVAATRVPACDRLVVAQRITTLFVLAWALIRVAVCIASEWDFEGFMAVVIVVGATTSLVRSFA